MLAVTAPLRFFEAMLLAYRRTWRGTVITSFVNPILFLSAMGLGLGSLVDSGSADLGVSYLPFVATGLLAANAMQNGAGEGMWQVMAGVKWRKNFHGAITTPISPADIIYGKVLWTFARLVLVGAVFAVIATLFGALQLGPALLAVFPAALVGVAFMSVLTAFTVTRESDESLANVFRFVIIPLFLFSGTFFPISQLPDFLQKIAYVTPLYHGVELVRKVALPGIDPSAISAMPAWVHLAYLLAMTAIGIFLSSRYLARRLMP
jgi:lipooligosaccharide transport system permease protein